MDTLKTKTLVWHHLQNPTERDFDFLRNRFKLHPVIFAELAKPTLRPKVERYDGYLYCALHFPIFDAKTRASHSREIDCIITPRALITVSAADIPPLTELFKKCETDEEYRMKRTHKTPAHLLYHLMGELLSFSLRQLDHIQKNVGRLEEKIFGGKERQIIEEILTLRRDILNFRKTVKPQSLTIDSLAEEITGLFGEDLKPFFDELKGEYHKVWTMLENHEETLGALSHTNESLMNLRQNEIMRTLTMMALFTFPLSLVAAIFGMNAAGTPIVENQNGFWIILATLIGIAAVMFAFFRKKGWL